MNLNIFYEHQRHENMRLQKVIQEKYYLLPIGFLQWNFGALIFNTYQKKKQKLLYL